MAGLGFQVYKRASAGSDPKEKIPSTASTQYLSGGGSALTVRPGSGNNGFANLVAAADKCTHIYESMITPDNVVQMLPADKSTALQENVLATPINPRTILKSWLVGDAVPTINKVACNTNSNAAQALVTAAGSTGDNTNGTIYIPELNQQRTITGDAVAGGVHTFTVAPAFTQAPTVGNTAIVVPFSKGCTGVKFNSSNPSQSLDPTVSGKSGGHNNIEDVNLKGDNFGPYVLSSCPDLQ
ncbi:MAG TPA: hypothetical protein V6D22_16880 [Candidatus Obscuribacterales bacterium]